jgi:hypothetical protein
VGLLGVVALAQTDAADAIKALKKAGATFLFVDNNPQKPVRSLYLPGNKVTDADLKLLKAFPQLQVLKLDAASKITDAGLKEVASLKHLQDLGLGSTQVTDAGLKHLAGLKQLKALNLNFTKVTDAGLEDLASLGRLELLGLSFTTVSPAAIKKLQQSLPKCKIIH